MRRFVGTVSRGMPTVDEWDHVFLVSNSGLPKDSGASYVEANSPYLSNIGSWVMWREWVLDPYERTELCGSTDPRIVMSSRRVER